jgi:hypothetical protein
MRKDKKTEIIVEFDLHYSSTNTRPKEFKNPVVVDNKKDIDNIIKKLTSIDLIEYYTMSRKDSKWKFYKFLDVKFHVYEMNTPIGKINELPEHFKTDSNKKALIKYENYDDYLCFWRCFAYHYKKPDDERRVENDVKKLFNMFYNRKNIQTYNGIEYVAYDKEYTEERLDADNYEDVKK